MKIFSLILAVSMLFFSFISVYADEGYEYYEVEQELRSYESQLRTQVKKGPSYIRQLESILGTLQSKPEQLNKIYERMVMLREPEKFEKMSDPAKILINYIYFSVVLLDLEPPVADESLMLTPTTAALPLSDFPEAEQLWRENLDVKISQMGYSMVYFNTETGIKSHPVTLKSMTLTGSGMSQDIAAPENAGVYMAGYIDIEVSGGYSFDITHSAGEAELIVAGKSILKSIDHTLVTLELESGRYLVELQYVNQAPELDLHVEIGQ